MDFYQLLTWLRGRSGERAIPYSEQLARGCELHCRYMAVAQDMSHSPFFHSGECVAVIDHPGKDPVQTVFQMWEQSPKHREILTASASQYGVFFLVTNNRIYATFRLL